MYWQFLRTEKDTQQHEPKKNAIPDSSICKIHNYISNTITISKALLNFILLVALQNRLPPFKHFTATHQGKINNKLSNQKTRQ